MGTFPFFPSHSLSLTPLSSSPRLRLRLHPRSRNRRAILRSLHLWSRMGSPFVRMCSRVTDLLAPLRERERSCRCFASAFRFRICNGSGRRKQATPTARKRKRNMPNRVPMFRSLFHRRKHRHAPGDPRHPTPLEIVEEVSVEVESGWLSRCKEQREGGRGRSFLRF